MVPIRRYARAWIAYVAGGGLVLACILWPSKWQRQDASKQSHDDTNNHGDDAKPRPPSQRYSHYKHPTDEEHRTAEQFNWRYSYRLNVGVAVAAVVAAVFAIGSFYESRRQANIADQTRLATARPWLDVEFYDGNLKWENGEPVIFDFNFVQRNLGFSPAIAYSLHEEVSTIDLKDGDPNPKIRLTCDHAEKLVMQASQQIIFMGKSSTGRSIGAFLSHKEIESYKQNWSNAVKSPIEDISSIWATYFVCAAYKIPGDNTWRHTGKYFTIGIKNAPILGVPINPGFAESPVTMREDGNYAD